MSSGASETTQLLLAWANGDPEALDELTPHVYSELRRIAGALMKKEQHRLTLQPTALVHEAYVRLIEIDKIRWEGKAHFFSLCARLMRRILVDAARKRATTRHGGAAILIDFNDASGVSV